MAALKDRLSLLGAASLPSNTFRSADGDLFEEDIWDDVGTVSSFTKSHGFELSLNFCKESVDGTLNDQDSINSNCLFPHAKKNWDFPSLESKLKNSKLNPNSVSALSPCSTLSFLDSVSSSSISSTLSRVIPTSSSGLHQPSLVLSAPVSIPVWNKIGENESRSTNRKNGRYFDEDDDGAENNIIPPHELLSQEHSKQVSFSVYEGVGRTLKGRDLNGFRRSVLRQTGFLESN